MIHAVCHIDHIYLHFHKAGNFSIVYRKYWSTNIFENYVYKHRYQDNSW